MIKYAEFVPNATPKALCCKFEIGKASGKWERDLLSSFVVPTVEQFVHDNEEKHVMFLAMTSHIKKCLIR